MTPKEEKPRGTRATVPVEIFGQSYTLRTDDDPAYVESLASFLDRRMREMADRTRTADTIKIAILAALNLADELHRIEAGGDPGSAEIAGRIKRMEALVDKALAPRA